MFRLWSGQHPVSSIAACLGEARADPSLAGF
jgi:hypothetical protein